MRYWILCNVYSVMTAQSTLICHLPDVYDLLKSSGTSDLPVPVLESAVNHVLSSDQQYPMIFKITCNIYSCSVHFELSELFTCVSCSVSFCKNIFLTVVLSAKRNLDFIDLAQYKEYPPIYLRPFVVFSLNQTVSHFWIVFPLTIYYQKSSVHP